MIFLFLSVTTTPVPPTTTRKFHQNITYLILKINNKLSIKSPDHLNFEE
jgi:hypothetical protein